MNLRRRLLLLAVGLLVSPIAIGRASPLPAAAASSVPTTSLRTLSTARLSDGGFLAWSGPALCDEAGNIYLLVVPDLAPNGRRGASAAPELAGPRDVLRISADGKKRVTFNPTAGSKFATAKEVSTNAMALDRDGRLFILIWARWSDKGKEDPKGGQYIASFDEKGTYRSEIEVDWEQMLVHQFEVFASGQFMLRGRRTHTAEPRVAIPPASGGALEDVRGLGGAPSDPLDDPLLDRKMPFGHMVRGGDGRIYVAESDREEGKIVVYAFRPSGDSEQVLKLRSIPGNPQMLGWKAAGSRLAAVYQQSEGSADGSPRWSIATYETLSGELQRLYGRSPGPPLCYQQTGSDDYFTFLSNGTELVRMSAQ